MEPTLFDTAIRQAAACARERYAGEEKRIERALLLALNGHVTVYPDSTAIVRSERNPEVVYNVRHHHCDCPDWGNAPDGRCKHVVGVALVTIAQIAMERVCIPTT